MGALSQEKNIFATVPVTDPLNFRTDDALDYKAVSTFLDLSPSDLSKIGGVQKKSVRFDSRIPDDLKTRLDEIANICSLVAIYFQGDAYKTALWFNTQNPMLGDVTPRDMIRLGRFKRLFKFISESLQLNEAKGP